MEQDKSKVKVEQKTEQQEEKERKEKELRDQCVFINPEPALLRTAALRRPGGSRDQRSALPPALLAHLLTPDCPPQAQG